MLNNISVKKETLFKFNPDVENLVKTIDVDSIIYQAKLDTFRQIKEDYKRKYGYMTNAQIDSDLSKIKDFSEGWVAERIAKLAIAQVYLNNSRGADEYVELYQLWKNEAYSISLISGIHYYIDSDNDEIVDSDEEQATFSLPRFKK